ncbi:MAG TPA: ABC transporter permease [Clostridiales bacterium]|nr:ABC transporter permease [Clostridiales bacterium]
MLSAEMLASAIRLAVPVIITAVGAIYSERSGVINIGLEGMMIAGCFTGAAVAFYAGPYAGILAAVAAGAFFALIHAVASVHFRVDQIVSGVAINILAYGVVRFSSLSIFKMATTTPHVDCLPKVTIPGLAAVPWLEPLVSKVSPLIFLAFLLIPFTAWVMNRTVFGLRLRSVGEHPLAAETLGVNVYLMKYCGVLISGALAGLSGAYLSIEHTQMYVEGMTQGLGFIALAAMIFGNWMPLGAMWAGLLFGFAQALSLRVVTEAVPYQFIKMVPYILTIVVLAGFVRRSRAPAAVGVPYERGEAA